MDDILKQLRWEEAYLISEGLYAAHGGCFPVIVKGGVLEALSRFPALPGKRIIN